MRLDSMVIFYLFVGATLGAILGAIISATI